MIKRTAFNPVCVRDHFANAQNPLGLMALLDEGWLGELEVEGDVVVFDADEAEKIIESVRIARAARPGSPVQLAFLRARTRPLTWSSDVVASSAEQRAALEGGYRDAIVERLRDRFQPKAEPALKRTPRFLPDEAPALAGGTGGIPGPGDFVPSLPPSTGVERFVANDDLPLLSLPDIGAEVVTVLQRGEQSWSKATDPNPKNGNA